MHVSRARQLAPKCTVTDACVCCLLLSVQVGKSSRQLAVSVRAEQNNGRGNVDWDREWNRYASSCWSNLAMLLSA
jgi:hypothetical protein